jgi:hypothetical protein
MWNVNSEICLTPSKRRDKYVVFCSVYKMATPITKAAGRSAFRITQPARKPDTSQITLSTPPSTPPQPTTSITIPIMILLTPQLATTVPQMRIQAPLPQAPLPYPWKVPKQQREQHHHG